jgi:hypothetical protein
MTAKKDLKQRIRERMQQTGEPYSVARRRVLAEREPADSSLREAATVIPEFGALPTTNRIEVVEMDDFTDVATGLGFKCTLSITRALADEIEPRTVLERFRDVLHGTGADPAMETMRTVVLRGEPSPARRPRIAREWQDIYDELRHFVARVRVGIGGVSEGGTMLAMPMQGKHGIVMVVCQLGFGIVSPARPRVVLTTAEASGMFVEAIAARKLAGTP